MPNFHEIDQFYISECCREIFIILFFIFIRNPFLLPFLFLGMGGRGGGGLGGGSFVGFSGGFGGFGGGLSGGGGAGGGF